MRVIVVVGHTKGGVAKTSLALALAIRRASQGRDVLLVDACERGRDLLLRLAEDVKEIGIIESQPLLDGRNMVMLLGPTKNAGVRRDAEDQNAQWDEEALPGNGSGEDHALGAAPDDAAGPSGEAEPGEQEAAPARPAGRA